MCSSYRLSKMHWGGLLHILDARGRVVHLFGDSPEVSIDEEINDSRQNAEHEGEPANVEGPPPMPYRLVSRQRAQERGFVFVHVLTINRHHHEVTNQHEQT